MLRRVDVMVTATEPPSTEENHRSSFESAISAWLDRIP